MRKRGHSNDDEIGSANGLLWLVSDDEGVGLPSGATVLPVFSNNGQALPVHDLGPSLGLVSTLAENANFDPGFRGGDGRQRVGAAASAADENTNRFRHVAVVCLSWPLLKMKMIETGPGYDHRSSSCLQPFSSNAINEIRRAAREERGRLMETGCSLVDSPSRLLLESLPAHQWA